MTWICLLLLQGPGPQPTLPPDPLCASLWIEDLIPFFVAGCAIAAMGVSILLRCSERFREFWTAHVCAFMEKHGRGEQS